MQLWEIYNILSTNVEQNFEKVLNWNTQLQYTSKFLVVNHT